MGNSKNTVSCGQCGGSNVKETKEGVYCNDCAQLVKKARAVHHECFPHVVVDENEQEP